MANKNRAKLTWDAALYQAEALKIRSDKDLREEYTRLRDIAQKRIKRLGQSEFNTSETYRHYKDMFPKLAEIKTNAELRKRLSELARFTQSKTSTVSGIKAKRKQQIEALHEQGYDWVTEDNFQQFYEWIDTFTANHQRKYYTVPEVKEAYEEQFGTLDPEEVEKEFEESEKMKPKPRRRNPKSSSDYSEGISKRKSRKKETNKANKSKRRRR